MQLHRFLSTVLLGAALLGAPLAASADPAPVATKSIPTARLAAVEDAALYAQREQQSPSAATFEGGGQAVYIGGSALTVVLIILLIVIVL